MRILIMEDELKMAELLRQPAAPASPQAIADLVKRRPAPSAAALDQPGMAAMLAGQQREDDIALAETPRRQDYALVMPFHGPPAAGPTLS